MREVNSTTGSITTIAGGGTATTDGVPATNAMLVNPVAVTLDSSGNLYIADYGANLIRRVGSDGTIHTIAGNGLQGFNGDGALATDASLNGPTDVKLDAQGNVYVVDSLNSSVRKLTPMASLPVPVISTIFNAGSTAAGAVTPGERVIITGTTLGPGSQVMFDTHPAPALHSSLVSALVVVPYEVASQSSSQVTVVANGVTSAPYAVQIAPAAPGIFTLSGDGQGQSLAIGSDGLINGPDDPVQAGNVISVLCTGEGVDMPASVTGVPTGPNPPAPVLPVTATIDGEAAQVAQAYSLSGAVGQFVVDIQVPSDASTDPNATVIIMVGNAMSQSTASISGRGQSEPRRWRR